MARICIPDHEYKERVAKCAAILQRRGLDALIVNGNEADYANPRYFSGYWPLFERAGVAISANGDAALMVGPESAEFGKDRNKLDKVFVLNLSAKIDGYSAAIGYPICLGKLEGERRDIVQFCRQAHAWTCDQVKAGVMAGDIAKNFYKYFCDNGFKDNFVYGPLHSTGIIEVEAPWAETTSMYPLQPNMTYQADTFISCPTFGVRWEKGIVVTEKGCDFLSPEIPEVCPELLF